jgi:hypothetical protein
MEQFRIGSLTDESFPQTPPSTCNFSVSVPVRFRYGFALQMARTEKTNSFPKSSGCFGFAACLRPDLDVCA